MSISSSLIDYISQDARCDGDVAWWKTQHIQFITSKTKEKEK